MEDTFHLAGYKSIRKSRPCKTGGVKKWLDFSLPSIFFIRDDLCKMNNFIECIFIEISQLKKFNILLGCIYSPPDTNIQRFNVEFLVLLDVINSGR